MLCERRVENALVASCTAVDEIGLDTPEIVIAHAPSQLRRVMQLAHGAGEGGEVIESDDAAGLPVLQEIGLAAAVVADHGNTGSHRLEKHQSKAFMLAG